MKDFLKGVFTFIAFVPLSVISLFQILGGRDVLDTWLGKFLDYMMGE